MSRDRLYWALGIIGFLVLLNVVSLIWNWGLITIHVRDAPLRKVVSSIEWQGWVKLYTDMDPTTKVTMDVDHVPVPEAMEALAEAVEGQWRLGFFAGPNSTAVKHEIGTFEAGGAGDESKIYSYMTPLTMFVSDVEIPTPDPRLQAWPGLPDFVLHPAAADPNAPAAPDPTSTAGGPPPAPAGPPTSVQGYLKTFAQLTDVWIMAPSDWDPPVASAPAPESSIVRAVKDFVSNQRGSVTTALVLRGRQRGPGGGRGQRGFGSADWQITEERMKNAVGGLPPETRAEAMSELAQEAKFFQDVQAAPADQRGSLMMHHMLLKIATNENLARRSPQRRAQMFARAVAAREAAIGGGSPSGGGAHK